MKERANIETKKSKTAIIVLFVLFAAVVCLRPAKTDYGFVYMVIAIALLGAAAYLIVHRYLTWYSYQLTGNELLIIKNVGSHETYLMIAPFDKITYIKPNDNSLSHIDYPVDNRLIGEFDAGGKKKTFSFSPSEDFEKRLKAILGDRFYG